MFHANCPKVLTENPSETYIELIKVYDQSAYTHI